MTLRARITLVAISITVLVAIVLSITARVSQSQSDARFASAVADGKSVLWRKIIASQMDGMENGVSSLVRDRATRRALKRLDREQLAESAQTSYNLLQASGVLDRLQITDVDGQLLFSAPESVRGRTGAHLIERALKGGKITRGLERGDDGRLLAIVAFPLSMRGQVIGAGVYARELTAAIADFKQNDASDVFVVDSSGVAEYATDRSLFQRLDLQLPALSKRTVDVAGLDDSVYSVVSLPIVDSEGEPVAHLVSVKDYTESFDRQKSFNFWAYLVTGTILMLAMVGFYWYMLHAMRPLDNAVVTLRSIADGDLTVQVNTTRNDEIGQLQTAMARTISQLRNLIMPVNEVAGKLYQTAARMTEITNETCRGVEKQEKEVTSVVTAMNQMTATVQEVARNAALAADAASNADSEANSSSQLLKVTIQAINELAAEVDNTSEAITRLRQDSENIGAVLDVIRSIAEQTNLLALNAAIEAARAGEQGRGFAVVADEVRTLASRTQESTQEIQEMIERLQNGSQNAVSTMGESRNKAHATAKQANKAETSLDTIIQAVSTINQMNVQIASAAEEQAAVAQEINQNVVSIHQVAESSAQHVHEIAENGGQLMSISRKMSELIGHFRI
ncbi:MAG TPA: methyl-accepting chemotaxis protein [Gammaproteobacteria bacterium]|nr:methyl-accepting chemotaxis protein [Gammaproteobacteria bacterium]